MTQGAKNDAQPRSGFKPAAIGCAMTFGLALLAVICLGHRHLLADPGFHG